MDRTRGRGAISVLAAIVFMAAADVAATPHRVAGQVLDPPIVSEAEAPSSNVSAPARSAARRSQGTSRGQRLFERHWRVAGTQQDESDGLGPVFNHGSCAGCHPSGGGGRPPARQGEVLTSLLIRLSTPGADLHGAPNPLPAYGNQLNDQAVPGVAPEGRAYVEYRGLSGQYGDGERFVLRKPTYLFHRLAFGDLPQDTMTSPRIAPSLHGLGLLEAVRGHEILRWAEPDDVDSDGISGRPNYVWDRGAKARVLGRFGWKANQPSLKQQVAAALVHDIGITTPLFPIENCAPAQADCLAAPSGGVPELTSRELDQLTSYVRELPPLTPAESADAGTRRGERLFQSAQCASCHRPRMWLDAEAAAEFGVSNIRPFTDLLLHDMGEGLADGRPDFEANGREWRTPPLWGIGLAEEANSPTFYLHDGRARDLAEAVLWHGGEAEPAKERFRAMDKSDRAALIAYLRSL